MSKWYHLLWTKQQMKTKYEELTLEMTTMKWKGIVELDGWAW